MFRKVLKYDVGAIIRLWSLLTVTVLVLSIVGGLCWRGIVAATGEQAQMPFIPLYILGIFLSIISIAAYGIATLAFVLVRYYRNFFTDEGYLTFTLPVKRSTLFNSKLLTAFIFNTATAIVTVIAITVLLAIAPGGQLGSSALSVIIDTLKQPIEALKVFINSDREIAFWLTTYAIAGVAYILVIFVHETLLLFSTVTFGSILAKKHKIIASVAVYYGVQMLLSTMWTIIEVFLSIGIQAITVVPEVISDGNQVLWLLLGVIVFYICALSLVASFFYKFTVSKLRGNLNLA